MGGLYKFGHILSRCVHISWERHTNRKKLTFIIHQYVFLTKHHTLALLLRLIRLSSPNLNYIIGGGAILLYAAVYLTVIPTTDRDIISATCNVSNNFMQLAGSCHFEVLLRLTIVLITSLLECGQSIC